MLKKKNLNKLKTISEYIDVFQSEFGVHRYFVLLTFFRSFFTAISLSGARFSTPIIADAHLKDPTGVAVSSSSVSHNIQ